MYKAFCEEMDKFVEEYGKKNKNTGVLRVTVKEKIIYEKFIGMADKENNVPFTKDSMFTLYSLSKPFLVLGLMKLKDKGLVDVDAHPSKYLPEAKGFDSRVTIRHMLHHNSGLPDFHSSKFSERYESGTPDKLREQMTELVKEPQFFEPGTSGRYQNINMIVGALIIENVTGMTYKDYMKKEVFEPLGIKTATIDSYDLVLENRVQGYDLANGEVIRTNRTLEYMHGAGDVIGTVDDVYCLSRAYQNKLLLKPETWAEVLTSSPHNQMGMGCFVQTWRDKLRIQNNGGSQGFRTIHVQFPEDDFDVIYLSNSGWGNARTDYVDAACKAFYENTDNNFEKLEMDAGYI